MAIVAALITACSPRPPAKLPPAADVDWPFYGADAGGERYSPAAQITAANVRALVIAWTYSTGDVASKGRALHDASFENTPILAGEQT